MNRGVPPTARKARTGEFTPPGVTSRARSNQAADTGASAGYGVATDGAGACVAAELELTGPVWQVPLCAARAALNTLSGIAACINASGQWGLGPS
jgi:hypothetical protein